MAKVNANYELVYIMDPAIGEEGIAALNAKFQDMIVAKEGTVSSVEEWGKRRMAYPINDLMDGYYMLVNFTATPDLPAALNRILRITDGVIRSMIICKDA